MAHKQITSGKCTWKMHEILVNNLDIIKKHNSNDWDFKILISGDGMTRTGKSTIGSQIAQYLDPTFADNWEERMIYDGKKLTEVAYKIGKNKAIVYDEAKAGLDSKRQMESYTKNLLDFFSQCGNLNHEIIIILPEFFDLPKSMALTQSIFLINCFARDGFKRGYFNFYNKEAKKYLYINGAKYLNYSVQSPSFQGTFVDYLPFDRQEYETIKSETLRGLRNKPKSVDMKERAETHRVRAKILIQKLMQECEVKSKDIAEWLAVSKATIFNTYLKEKS